MKNKLEFVSILVLTLASSLVFPANALAITPIMPITVMNDALNQPEQIATNLGGLYGKTGITQVNAGMGIKVGVIDSGIAVYRNGLLKTNSCFDDAGYPATKQLGDTRYTNNKVIVARVFTAPRIETAPGQFIERGDAQAVAPHGSHVAGIIGCNANTQTSISGTPTGLITGIAPKVQFGSYVVFPGDEDQFNGARPEYIANAIDSAVADGMNIINMSLGGPTANEDQVVYDALERAHKAGVLVVIAAGNEGPAVNTVGSPGNWGNALTVGSVSGGRELQTTLVINGKKYTGAVGNIGIPVHSVSAPLVIAGSDSTKLSNVCNAGDIGSEVSGKIAVVARGGCYFYPKLQNLVAKGAVGVVVVSQPDKAATAMGGPSDAIVNTAAIVVSDSDKASIMEMANKGTVGTFETLSLVKVTNINEVSNFSSGGAAPITGLVKPDILAPGEDIISAASSNSVQSSCAITGTCFMIMSGTSMATPYIVGIAAILKQAHPDWSVDMIRSALIHTASTKEVKGNSANNIYRTGLGLVDPAKATVTRIGIDQTSLMLSDQKSVSVGIINNQSSDLAVKILTDSPWVTSKVTSVTLKANSVTQVDLETDFSLATEGNVAHFTVTDGDSSIQMLIRYQSFVATSPKEEVAIPTCSYPHWYYAPRKACVDYPEGPTYPLLP